MGIERQDVRDKLVRPHHHHAASVSIDTAHIKNVVAAFQVGAEHFLVVAQLVAALSGQQQWWHRLDREVAMPLLEDCPDVDHAIDICTGRRVFPDGRRR